MIPKIIHQIFFNIQNKELTDIDVFYRSHLNCSNQQGFEYILWNEKDCKKLIKEDYNHYLEFYNNLRFDIQRLDFVRFCILHKYGGFYIDLDMFILNDLTPLLNNTKVFHNIKYVKANYSFIENDFIGSIKNYEMWYYVMNECVKNYKEKSEIEIYKTWKGRFVLQTTGPKFLSRFVKKVFPNYQPKKLVYTKWNKDEKDTYYIEDYKLNSWIKNEAKRVI